MEWGCLPCKRYEGNAVPMKKHFKKLLYVSDYIGVKKRTTCVALNRELQDLQPKRSSDFVNNSILASNLSSRVSYGGTLQKYAKRNFPTHDILQCSNTYRQTAFEGWLDVHSSP